MKTLVAISVVILVSCGGLAAQTASKPAAASTSSSPGCPVSLTARQRAWGDLMEINRAHNSNGILKPVGGPGQRIALAVKSASEMARVVKARVTVHGTGLNGRALPLQFGGDSPTPRTKTLDVTFSDSGPAEALAELKLPGFTSVSWISVESVTYADGSNWNAAPARSCRTDLDPLMLIAAH
jgi:hypothetical protein